MSVYKRKGSPFYWYNLTIDGQRVRRSSKTDDKALALQIEAKERSQTFMQSNFGKKPDITLDAAFARFWLEHASNLKSASRSGKYILRRLLAGLGKTTLLKDVDDDMIARYIAKRQRQKTPRGGQVSPSTINRELTAFASLHNRARRKWKVAVADIDINQHKLKEPECRLRWLTPDEADTLIYFAPDYLKPVIRFALLTGWRKSNILTLRRSQVNLQAGVITTFIKSKLPGGKRLDTPIHTALEKLLTEIGIHSMQPDSLVFTDNGRPIGDFKRAWKTTKKLAGIHDFRFHDLRHTCASWMVQQGAPIDIVKKVLGHTNISTTLKYAHHKNDAAENAMNLAFSSQKRHNRKL